jgi:hypothetical protein
MYNVKKCKAALAMILVLGLLIASVGFPVEAEESGLVFGDANGDGIASPADFTLLTQYISGSIQSLPYYLGDYTMDLNNDGYINTQDVTLLGRYLSGTLASFPSADIVKNMPQTVFQYTYVNGAWGYVNINVTIDKNGNIYTNSTIAPQIDPSTVKVPKKELEAMYMDLNIASQGAISDRTMQSCDRGLYTYSGYIMKNGILQNVFLRLDGDDLQENLSPYSLPLVDWLDGYVSMLY